MTGDADRRLVAPLFLAFAMSLQLDIDIPWSEDSYQHLYDFATSLFAAVHQSCGQWAFVTTCEADETLRVLLQFRSFSRAFLLRLFAHLVASNELAEVLITFAGFTEKRKTHGFGEVLVWQRFGRREPLA